MNLTDRDKQIIKDQIEREEPLPAKYKVMLLFTDAPEVGLIWRGKRVVHPFRSREQIDSLHDAARSSRNPPGPYCGKMSLVAGWRGKAVMSQMNGYPA